MTGCRLAFLLGTLSTVACSGPREEAPPPEILCAAEALHMARSAASSRAEEDNLRARADRFIGKLTIPEQQRLWTKIDQLADKRGSRPLIDEATCEALLTAEDRRQLSTSATAEAITPKEAVANNQ
jgi:hypothetical protein